MIVAYENTLLFDGSLGLISLRWVLNTLDWFINNPIPGIVGILYTVIYFKTIENLSAEPSNLVKPQKPEGDGVLKKIQHTLLGYIFELQLHATNALANDRLVNLSYKERFWGYSLAKAVDTIFQFAFVLSFFTLSFAFLFFRASKFEILNGTTTSILMIGFLGFSYRLSRRLPIVYLKLKRPLREARAEVGFRNNGV
ncbi:hypothetical protein [Halobacterium wangiae]|uniref:hypothetical protein n=1 Tax=Halobacterium wangiae TaxID=2902623 RepID=UPI001E370AD7|nr:hypothetical protein [Halobacterium wangiae]